MATGKVAIFCILSFFVRSTFLVHDCTLVWASVAGGTAVVGCCCFVVAGVWTTVVGCCCSVVAGV